MKKITFGIMLFSIMMMISCAPQKQRPDYPETRKGDVVDEYFGNEVADPYRWLEDDMSDETAGWVKAQNDVTPVLCGFFSKSHNIRMIK